jgi:hypothetical protein
MPVSRILVRQPAPQTPSSNRGLKGRCEAPAPTGILLRFSFSLGSGRNGYGGNVETIGARSPELGVNSNAEDNCRHCFRSGSGPVSSRGRRPDDDDHSRGARRRPGAEDGNSPPPSPHEAATHAYAADGTHAPASRRHRSCRSWRSCTVDIGARPASVPIEASKTLIEFTPWRGFDPAVYQAAGFGLLAVSQLKTPRVSAGGF